MMKYNKATLLWILALLASTCLPAENYTVNSIEDNGQGTGTTGDLRYCIEQSNLTNNGPDTITFDVTGTIILNSQLVPPSQQLFIDGSSAPNYAPDQPQIALSGYIFALVNPGSNGSHIKGLSFQNSIGNGIEINGVDSLLIDECFVGTNLGGFLGAPSLANGILAVNTSHLTIKNSVISGNLANGLYLGDCNHINITGCHIGINAQGNGPVSNGQHGVLAFNTPYLTISNSIVSGNNAIGIVATNCPNIAIYGNHIGTNQEGNEAVANLIKGVELWDACDSSIIGGSSVDSLNVISGNIGDGISLMGAQKANIRIEGNLIGLNLNGDAAIPNGKGIADFSIEGTEGLLIKNNVISGNGIATNGEGDGQGVNLLGVKDLIIQGNLVGTSADGFTSIPNGHNAIDLNDCHNALIGGAATSHRNIISGTAGLTLHGLILQGEERCNNPIIINNFIGTNIEGRSMGMPTNQGYGIVCKGDSALISENIVSGNGQWGILITDGIGGEISHNLVGVDIDTNALGNGYGGVAVRKESAEIAWDTRNNTVKHNIIAYNGFDFQYTGPAPAPVQEAAGPGIGLAIMEWSEGNPLTDNILLTENSIYCNAGKGIDLNFGQPNVPANDGKASPEITLIENGIHGIATPGDTIEIYEAGECSQCGVFKLQGKHYINKIITLEDGTWHFDEADPSVMYTFVARDESGNTSEFSGCPECLFPTANAGEDAIVPVGATSITLEAEEAILPSIYGDRTITYNWSSSINNEELSPVDERITEASPTETTTYYIVQVADGDCVSADTVEITLDFDIFIPSGFSPNNDGDNDEFQIHNAGRYPGNLLEVYNRWGSLVYKTEAYGTNGTFWNGTTSEGKDLPMATYYYVFTTGEGDESYAGPVTIIR